MCHLSLPTKLLIYSWYVVFFIYFYSMLAYFLDTATSVDVERIFSKGRLVLSHVRNQLTVQSTHALLCLGAWSRLGHVKDKDILAAAVLPDVQEDEE
jgi:hypothetical protein